MDDGVRGASGQRGYLQPFPGRHWQIGQKQFAFRVCRNQSVIVCGESKIGADVIFVNLAPHAPTKMGDAKILADPPEIISLARTATNAISAKIFGAVRVEHLQMDLAVQLGNY